MKCLVKNSMNTAIVTYSMAMRKKVANWVQNSGRVTLPFSPRAFCTRS